MSTLVSPRRSEAPGIAAIPDRLPVGLRDRLLRWEIILLAFLVLVFFLNTQLSPYFLDPWNLSDATFNFTEKAIIALPMALLIIARDIDLSVASTIALASTLMGAAAEAGAGPVALLLVGLGVGLLAGLFNGWLVTTFALPAIVVTIGTMSLYRGISYIILGDQSYGSYPEGFEYFGRGYVAWVLSFEFTLFLVLALGSASCSTRPPSAAAPSRSVRGRRPRASPGSTSSATG